MNFWRSRIDFHTREAGFSMVETVISAAAVLSITAAVGVNVNAVKDHMRTSERVLAMDHVERNLSNLVTDPDTVRYSILRAGPVGLRQCVLMNTPNSCRSGNAYRLSIYPEGHSRPVTGPDVSYDETGNICDSCDSSPYSTKVDTVIQVNCAGGNACSRPSTMVMLTMIKSVAPDNEIVLKERRRYGEVQKVGFRKFPDLSVECSSPNEALRGIGLVGQAICEPLSSIKYTDENGDELGPLNVTPINCSASISPDDEAQSFVTGFDNRGNVSCGDRFW